MNGYQKFSVFFIRLSGLVAALCGLMGALYLGMIQVFGVETPLYSGDGWPASLVWGIFGVVLFILANPVGRFLGRGLD